MLTRNVRPSRSRNVSSAASVPIKAGRALRRFEGTRDRTATGSPACARRRPVGFVGVAHIAVVHVFGKPSDGKQVVHDLACRNPGTNVRAWNHPECARPGHRLQRCDGPSCRMAAAAIVPSIVFGTGVAAAAPPTLDPVGAAGSGGVRVTSQDLWVCGMTGDRSGSFSVGVAGPLGYIDAMVDDGENVRGNCAGTADPYIATGVTRSAA